MVETKATPMVSLTAGSWDNYWVLMLAVHLDCPWVAQKETPLVGWSAEMLEQQLAERMVLPSAEKRGDWLVAL